MLGLVGPLPVQIESKGRHKRMDLLEQIKENVIRGNVAEVERLTKDAIKREVDVKKVLDEGYVGGLDVIGEKYSAGEIFLPEMLVAARAVSAGMGIVKPLLIKSGTKSKGVVVLGTVEGDVHDIGKNIVGMMLEGAGFRVIDIGVDKSSEHFIKTAKANSADIIAMSALLSTTRNNMKGIVTELRNSEVGRAKIMVGGAPVTEKFAISIGADGYAPDAGLAVKKAKELLDTD